MAHTRLPSFWRALRRRQEQQHIKLFILVTPSTLASFLRLHSHYRARHRIQNHVLLSELWQAHTYASITECHSNTPGQQFLPFGHAFPRMAEHTSCCSSPSRAQHVTMGHLLFGRVIPERSTKHRDKELYSLSQLIDRLPLLQRALRLGSLLASLCSLAQSSHQDRKYRSGFSKQVQHKLTDSHLYLDCITFTNRGFQNWRDWTTSYLPEKE